MKECRNEMKWRRNEMKKMKWNEEEMKEGMYFTSFDEKDLLASSNTSVISFIFFIQSRISSTINSKGIYTWEIVTGQPSQKSNSGPTHKKVHLRPINLQGFCLVFLDINGHLTSDSHFSLFSWSIFSRLERVQWMHFQGIC